MRYAGQCLPENWLAPVLEVVTEVELQHLVDHGLREGVAQAGHLVQGHPLGRQEQQAVGGKGGGGR